MIQIASFLFVFRIIINSTILDKIVWQNSDSLALQVHFFYYFYQTGDICYLAKTLQTPPPNISVTSVSLLRGLEMHTSSNNIDIWRGGGRGGKLLFAKYFVQYCSQAKGFLSITLRAFKLIL